MSATLALTLLSFSATPPQRFEDHLAPPVRLEADGKLLDISKDTAYAGPWVIDHDGDSKDDLIVTSIRGYLRWYRNVSEGPEPVYQDQGRIEARGKAIKFWNW